MNSEAPSPVVGKPPARRLWVESLLKLRELFRETAPSPQEVQQRLRTVERDVVLPVKGAFLVVLFYFLYLQPWYEFVDTFMAVPRSVVLQIFKQFFLIYSGVNLAAAIVLWNSRRVSGSIVQVVLFSTNFLDGLFVAALLYMTGGLDSLVFWLFPGLILRNALSCPRARPQIILNVSVSMCYLMAGLLDVAYPDEMLDYGESALGGRSSLGFSLWHFLETASHVRAWEMHEISGGPAVNPAQQILIRVLILLLWSTWCYGVQVLLEKQRRVVEQTKESSARQKQLHAAGRMAAEIAHGIKNPLGIINAIAYSLQEGIRHKREPNPKQLEIIRTEVAKADSIITQLLGYSQLAEGRVEPLHVEAELDQALREVFPPGASYRTRVEKRVAPELPVLLMQRAHLSQILVNVLLNAREVLEGGGEITLTAWLDPKETIVITIGDNGPGIPPERIERIFEPYVTFRPGGSGLGLSVARHNIEFYGGTIRAESELGQGARFILHLPTRTYVQPT